MQSVKVEYTKLKCDLEVEMYIVIHQVTRLIRIVRCIVWDMGTLSRVAPLYCQIQIFELRHFWFPGQPIVRFCSPTMFKGPRKYHGVG